MLIRRTQDYDSYHVRVSFAPGFELRRVGPHAFVIGPPVHASATVATAGDTNDSHRATQAEVAPTSELWVTVGFAPTTEYLHIV